MADILEILESGRLQHCVDKLFPRGGGDEVVVGLTIDGEHRVAAPETAHSPTMSAGRLGCITKLLTAALLRQSIARGLLTLETRLDELFNDAADTGGVTDVAMKHLLNHTHGLDDSGVPGLPRRKDGYSDARALCAALFEAKRIASAGRYYSYGHGGAWLAAAALEKVHERPYWDVLETNLLAVLGISSARARYFGRENLCPAVGGEFGLTGEEMLRFLDYQMACADFGFCGDARDLAAETVPLPGWHSTEHGVFLAWKYYGNGWYGHNSQIPQAGMLVRMNPARRLGVVVSSGPHAPARVARMVFRDYLPDLITLDMPRLRTERSVGAREARLYVGQYGNRATSVAVSVTESALLQLDATQCNHGRAVNRRSISTLLRPAENDIFFLESTFPETSPYIQFLETGHGVADALWNGVTIFPRKQ